MGDALFQYFSYTLPASAKEHLSIPLSHFESGNYHEILSDDFAKILFGHEHLATSEEQIWQAPAPWNDWIFTRIGQILKSRQLLDGDAGKDSDDHLQWRSRIFLIGLAAFSAFMQRNSTGPPLNFPVLATILPKEATSDATQISKLRENLIASLIQDGISTYKLVPDVELLCLADAIFTSPPIVKGVDAADWARLRVNFIHQRVLSETSPSVQGTIQEALQSMDKKFAEMNQDLKQSWIPEFLLERAAIETYYGSDHQAREAISQAGQLNDFQYTLTGRLGKRTKFQHNDLSQLVVLAKSSDSKGTIPPDTGSKSNTKKNLPANLNLDDDTLLESITFKKEGLEELEAQLPPALAALDPSDQPKLHPLDAAILLAFAASIKNTSPEDGLTREETLPYAIRALEGGSSNWQVYTQALLVRSRIESYKSRTAERGLLQLQALVDQVIVETTGSTDGPQPETAPTTFFRAPKPSESAPAQERLRYVFQLASPLKWELEAELAAKWAHIGGLKTALDIFERLQMWPEVASCLAAVGREQAARRTVRKQLFKSSRESEVEASNEDELWAGEERDPLPSDAPRLYCILGDLDENVDFFYRAWEVSNKRYARAQRSIGKHYFDLKQYAKAAEAYRAALAVSQLHLRSWFNLGCARLQLEEFSEAIEAFQRCVQLDDTHVEAWTNLGSAWVERGRRQRAPTDNQQIRNHENDEQVKIQSHNDDRQFAIAALQCFKRAAALQYDDSRIWTNVLIAASSTKPPSYNDIVRSMSRIIDIRGKVEGERCIDVDILDALVRDCIMTSEPGATIEKTGLTRTVVALVEGKVIPLITSDQRLWQIVERLAIWRGKPEVAMDAALKAWRATTSAPGWEDGSQEQFAAVVDSTISLVDAYESLGNQTRSTSPYENEPQLVAPDWKFKARSAIRTVSGRAKASWEGSEGWDRLQSRLQDLRAQ